MTVKDTGSQNEWMSERHVIEYLDKYVDVSHRNEGESVLLDHVPNTVKRIVDLGTGDGRLLNLLKTHRSHKEIEEAVAIDMSPSMLKRVKENFSHDNTVKIIEHDLKNPLPELGQFDAVVSSFAIHHLEHERKKSLYTEIFSILKPKGVFCNLEHVASPTQNLHERFFEAIGTTVQSEDKSDKLLDVNTQLEWLKTIGFTNVDCYWKWLEMALLIGVKP
jgi:tRNA (cmo5U34)-methyltransferase